MLQVATLDILSIQPPGIGTAASARASQPQGAADFADMLGRSTRPARDDGMSMQRIDDRHRERADRERPDRERADRAGADRPGESSPPINETPHGGAAAADQATAQASIDDGSTNTDEPAPGIASSEPPAIVARPAAAAPAHVAGPAQATAPPHPVLTSPGNGTAAGRHSTQPATQAATQAAGQVAAQAAAQAGVSTDRFPTTLSSQPALTMSAALAPAHAAVSAQVLLAAQSAETVAAAAAAAAGKAPGGESIKLPQLTGAATKAQLKPMPGQTKGAPTAGTASSARGQAIRVGATAQVATIGAAQAAAGASKLALAFAETAPVAQAMRIDSRPPAVFGDAGSEALRSAGVEEPAPTSPAATAARAAARLAARPAPQPAARQVAVHIQRGLAAGADRISIRLHPAELGRVEVRMEVGHDKTLQAIIMVDRAETLELLSRDARSLQQALADAGLATNQDSLTFQHRETGAEADDTEHAEAGLTDDETNEPADGLLPPAQRRHDGILNIQV